MAYNGPRRKSKLQKACEALDPGVRLMGPETIGGCRIFWIADSAGQEIGYTDGNENWPVYAWRRALVTLQRRARDGKP